MEERTGYLVYLTRNRRFDPKTVMPSIDAAIAFIEESGAVNEDAVRGQWKVSLDRKHWTISLPGTGTFHIEAVPVLR